MQTKRIVIKIGTKCLTSKDRSLDRERVQDVVRQLSALKGKGCRTILVTSGAIGAGMWILGLKRRPAKLADLQAAAAVGQGYLMQVYSEAFKARGHAVGQILLTQEDFNDRERYLNIRHTIMSLLDHGVVPIINENDTVATDEIKCGDNDRLSSLVADLCEADRLVLTTDVDGLLDRDGTVIPLVERVTPEIMRLGGASHCDLGTGGMATKLEAARTVNRAGIECFIVNGRTKDIIIRASLGEPVGTRFLSGDVTVMAKQRWIAFSSKAKGKVVVDAGAREALKKRSRSLLASGVIGVEGHFGPGDVVSITGRDGEEIGRGVPNYSSTDIAKIKGLKTSAYQEALGRVGPDEVIHRDNLVVLLT